MTIEAGRSNGTVFIRRGIRVHDARPGSELGRRTVTAYQLHPGLRYVPEHAYFNLSSGAVLHAYHGNALEFQGGGGGRP